MSKRDNRKNLQYATLLSVLAQGSTDGARSILKKYSGQDAKDLTDLEIKLANMYSNSPKKIDIEKDFADIHPHKDFILKYLSPKEVDKQVPMNNEAENKIVAMATDSKTSSCEGNCNCGCHKSNINGDYSNVGGETQNSQTSRNQVYMLGFVSIVAIFGMALIYKQK